MTGGDRRKQDGTEDTHGDALLPQRPPRAGEDPRSSHESNRALGSYADKLAASFDEQVPRLDRLGGLTGHVDVTACEKALSFDPFSKLKAALEKQMRFAQGVSLGEQAKAYEKALSFDPFSKLKATLEKQMRFAQGVSLGEQAKAYEKALNFDPFSKLKATLEKQMRFAQGVSLGEQAKAYEKALNFDPFSKLKASFASTAPYSPRTHRDSLAQAAVSWTGTGLNDWSLVLPSPRSGSAEAGQGLKLIVPAETLLELPNASNVLVVPYADVQRLEQEVAMLKATANLLFDHHVLTVTRNDGLAARLWDYLSGPPSTFDVLGISVGWDSTSPVLRSWIVAVLIIRLIAYTGRHWAREHRNF